MNEKECKRCRFTKKLKEFSCANGVYAASCKKCKIKTMNEKEN